MFPIEHHSLLSDQRGLALVDPEGALCWWCAPRPDSAPIFGRLLDDNGGHFRIASTDGARPKQAYRPQSMTLESQYEHAVLRDYMDPDDARAGVLHRSLTGTGQFEVTFAPRLDLGRIPTRIEATSDRSWSVNDGAVILRSNRPVAFSIAAEGEHQTATATVHLDAPLVFELQVGAARGGAAPPWAADDADTQRVLSEQRSATWLSTLTLPASAHAALLERSALLLRGLVYRPTGAIVAAATTSLPEVLGGVRNWDYRFCWPRDASMTAAILARLGDTSVGLRLLDFLLGRTADLEADGILEPLYSVSGERLDGEELRDDVAGYRSSAPVRIGNGAAGQIQLDAFGPVVDLVATLHRLGAPLTHAHTDLVQKALDAVCRSWDRLGHGVWELRAKERAHVFSRGMCWMALERGAAVLQVLDPSAPVAKYRKVACAIRAQVQASGFCESVGAYTMAYGEDDLDAAVLRLIGIGFFQDEARERSTVAAIEAQLDAWPAIYRYRMPDGLPGDEGGFVICGFWLVDALTRLGDLEAAERRLDALAALAGPTGLFAEEHDPKTQLALGNLPQAYSHLGLLESALLLQSQRPSANAADTAGGGTPPSS